MSWVQMMFGPEKKRCGVVVVTAISLMLFSAVATAEEVEEEPEELEETASEEVEEESEDVEEKETASEEVEEESEVGDDEEELVEDSDEEKYRSDDQDDEGEPLESESVSEEEASEDQDEVMVEVEAKDEEADDDPIGLEAKIIEIRGGSAVIDLGRNDGLSKDKNVELYAIDHIRIGAEEVAEERSLGIGRIHTLGESYAEVALPLNVTIREGMFARVTDQRVTTQPQPTLENVLTLDANLRPFLPIDSLGIGVLGEFGLGYHFSGPWVFEVRADPVGLTVTDSDSEDVRTFAANAIMSYAGEFFQVGLGAGVSRVHWGFGDRRMTEPPSTQESLGVSAAQYVRLGRMDDVYVSLTTNFVVVDRAWQFGGAMLKGLARAQAIGEHTWYMGRIGGGVPGHFLVEVGLRQLISGNGGPGSVFITPTVGIGHIGHDIYREEEGFEGETHWVREDLGYLGPMIGFGVEWRQ